MTLLKIGIIFVMIYYIYQSRVTSQENYINDDASINYIML